MRTETKYLSLSLGVVAALVVTAVPAAAGSFSQPGSSMGAPAGAIPPPGLYFVNSANYGISAALPNADTVAVGVEAPVFIWSTGWNFLGASYAASVAFPFVDLGIRSPGHAADTYKRAPFSPYINPLTLSWNLGNGLFVSFGEGIYIPIVSEVTLPSATTFPGFNTSAASFEQRVAVSYIANDWILSANGILGIVTKDSLGNQGVDYFNFDWTIAHTFGKWEIGVVGYGAWDIDTTVLNAAAGRNREIGFGGLLGYNFGPVDLTLELTHEFLTKGASNYGYHDTRLWTTLVIPIWNPAPVAPARTLVAK